MLESKKFEMKKAKLSVENLSISYTSPRGEVIEAIKHINLRVQKGELLVILGPSGCGKSTLLRAIAGLEKPTKGKLYIDGKEIVGPGRDRGMVFQSYTSFPWLTVQKNVEFGLRLADVPEPEIFKTAQHYITEVGLEEFQHSYPKTLSGGMKQRVAIARTLANKPDLLLMDEPFGALDAQTRWQMQELVLKLCASSEITVIFITHDVEEAVFLADRIYVSTARPSRLKEEISVPFTNRTPELKTTSEFIAIEERILKLIREESIGQVEASI